MVCVAIKLLTRNHEHDRHPDNSSVVPWDPGMGSDCDPGTRVGWQPRWLIFGKQ